MMQPRSGASLILARTTIAAFLAIAPFAHAQGCSLCRDATAGSVPQVRRALRIAIPVLLIPAVVILGGTLVVLRRIQPNGDEDEAARH